MTDQPPSSRDREAIRVLARRWAEIAALPVMADRKRGWRALDDLCPERPMIQFEAGTVAGYVADDELRALGVRHALGRLRCHARDAG